MHPSPQILSLAVGGSAGLAGPSLPPTPPPSDPHASHRYYQCIRYEAQTHCREVEKGEALQQEGSQTIRIRRWIPSKLDRPLLSYKMWWNHSITVSKSQQNPTDVQK